MAVFKNKKNNTWTVKFYYKDWQGERKQHKKMGFKTQKEAKQYEIENLNKFQGSSEITYGGLYEYYMADCRARLKPTTVSNKEFMFEAHILPFFKNIKIKDITTHQIRSWQNKMLTEKLPNGKGKYNPTYLRVLNNQLSASLNFAVRVFGLRQNPCSIVGAMGKNKAETMLFWTYDEFAQFIAAFENDKLYKTLFSLMFFSGARIGECLALTMDNVNIFKGTIYISKTLAEARGKVYLLEPKTELSKREITLPKFMINMIVDLFNSTYERDSSAYLFPVERTTIRTHFNNACKSTGVKRIRLHDLRHSHASMLMNSGIPIKQISQRLGHKDIKITLEIYAHLYKETENALVESLEKIGKEMAL